MSIQQKTVFETRDGMQFETEEEAGAHQLRIDLADPIQVFLGQSAVTSESRVRGSTVAKLITEFSVKLLTPGAMDKLLEKTPHGNDRAQNDSPDAQGPDQTGEAGKNLED